MRVRTHSLTADSSYGAVGFLPTTLPADNVVPFAASSSSTPTTAVGPGQAPGQGGQAACGLLSPAQDILLRLPDAARLIARVCAELERTGVAIPFVFSTISLDVRRPVLAGLVHAFLATRHDSNSNSSSRNGSQQAEERWA
ncbi:hypothetical protein C8R44DRAFT_894928 [Mycena epipterygia]|nr:hypothetical protein C8R44DRAFT_894928 [Mycena epipterygia]